MSELRRMFSAVQHACGAIRYAIGTLRFYHCDVRAEGHAIRDERDDQRHLDYIHYNPVKHGYAQAPHEWPYSSLARRVGRGMYSADWAAGAETVELNLE